MKTKKKKGRSSPKIEHFFSPNSNGHLRSDAHQSQIIGGDAEKDHTQTIGGMQSNYWGGFIPPGLGTPGRDIQGFAVVLLENAAPFCHRHRYYVRKDCITVVS